MANTDDKEITSPNIIMEGMKYRPNEKFEKQLFKASKVNLDLSHRCPLECLRCARQTYESDGKGGLKKKPIPGRDITMDEFDKITNYFDRIQFCGQYSDPVHHPHFIDMLKMIKRKGNISQVHSASTFKSDKFFEEAFRANVDTQWWFGIDGLPKDSHKYRVHQNGELHFKRLKMARGILKKKPIWQMIMFNYNQHDVEKCMTMAKEIDVIFNVIQSSRWVGDDETDPLIPKEKKLDVDDHAFNPDAPAAVGLPRGGIQE